MTIRTYKPLWCAFALLALAHADVAVDLRPELQPIGKVEHLGWAQGGNLWFGTEAGQVYVSRDGGHGWNEVAVSPRRARNQQDSVALVDGDQLSRVLFFDDRRGLALGYAHGRKESAYRTADGGATWKALKFPTSLLVDDAQLTPEGRGWLVGFSGEVLTTKDFGATWRSLATPSHEDTSLNSVRFTSPATGVVAADSLYLTRDGGVSWQHLPDPHAQGLAAECNGTMIWKARPWAGWLLAHQCERWFASPFPETGGAEGSAAETLRWRPLLVSGRQLLEVEPVGERLLAVTEDREVVFLDRALELASRSGFTLPSPPVDIAVRENRIAILDRDEHVTVLANGSFARFAMLREGATGRPDVFAFDRGADGTLWGVSPFFLYRSRDSGRTWERQAELPQPVHDVALRTSGEVLLWNKHGYAASYDPRTGVFSPVSGLEKLDVVGLFRRGDLWLVYGGLQQETAGRVEVIRVFKADQFEGSAAEGFVAASTDGGGRWQVIDRWEKSGPQALFLADDNTLTLLSWLGSVRRGKLTFDEQGRASASLSTVFKAEGTFSSPYVQTALWLDFLAGDEGWVRGWVDHVGNFLYRSVDGGRSWLPGEPQRRSFSYL
ncbi:MAG TPA: YCF48-related protein, partial [Thermoanaerobaculia bacterium]|nr:YCF48-related protein [Thermoanaerobaculia bacterium]